MTIMGNNCGPRAVAEYERQCCHDFIFPSAHSVNGPTHPKDETSGAAPTDAASSRPAASSPCAAETLTSALPGGARSSGDSSPLDEAGPAASQRLSSLAGGCPPRQDFAPSVDACIKGTSHAGEHPAWAIAPTPATAALPPAAVAGPLFLYVAGCALMLFGAVQLAASVGTY